MILVTLSRRKHQFPVEMFSREVASLFKGVRVISGVVPSDWHTIYPDIARNVGDGMLTIIQHDSSSISPAEVATLISWEERLSTNVLICSLTSPHLLPHRK